MKKLYILLIALFLMNGASGQWMPQNSGTTKQLNSVYFTDVNTGYIVGDSGIILKTINGGTDWINQNSGTSVWLSSVHFPKPDTGYAVGGNWYPITSVILKTINGGENWTTQFDSLGIILNSVFFTDASTGYAVGDNGTILKTTDGGMNWLSQNLGLDCDFSSVHFPAVDTGFICGECVANKILKILKTTDGGQSWVEKYSDTVGGRSYGKLFSIHFPNLNTGYAVGEYCYWIGGCYGIIRKTDDGGSNWISSGTNNPLGSVFFIDETVGYSVGERAILNTIDGGENWTYQYYNTNNEYLISVYFPSTDTGYAVGYNYSGNGTILKTTNGGYPMGISDQSNKSNILKIHPNPTSTSISIETSIKGSLYILNLNSQSLLQQEITEPKTTVDVSNLPNGIYMVKVVGEKRVQVGKFVKQ